jgi:hypothetical protein
MCVLRRAHYAWWCVSKATSRRLWLDRYNLQGADFGALHNMKALALIKFSLWVYDILKQKICQFLLNFYYGPVWNAG